MEELENRLVVLETACARCNERCDAIEQKMRTECAKRHERLEGMMTDFKVHDAWGQQKSQGFDDKLDAIAQDVKKAKQDVSDVVRATIEDRFKFKGAWLVAGALGAILLGLASLGSFVMQLMGG